MNFDLSEFMEQFDGLELDIFGYLSVRFRLRFNDQRSN